MVKFLMWTVQVMAATVLSYLDENGYLEPPQSGRSVECPA